MAIKSAIIVDDSKLARVTLRKKLGKHGVEADMAESATQAFELMQNKAYDIVFMDHLMPEIDGFEATQQLRSKSEYAGLPIIMCTGKEHEGYLQEAQEIGANYTLTKPPTEETLEAILAMDFTPETVVEDMSFADISAELDAFDSGAETGLDAADVVAEDAVEHVLETPTESPVVDLPLPTAEVSTDTLAVPETDFDDDVLISDDLPLPDLAESDPVGGDFVDPALTVSEPSEAEFELSMELDGDFEGVQDDNVEEVIPAAPALEIETAAMVEDAVDVDLDIASETLQQSLVDDSVVPEATTASFDENLAAQLRIDIQETLSAELNQQLADIRREVRSQLANVSAPEPADMGDVAAVVQSQLQQSLPALADTLANDVAGRVSEHVIAQVEEQIDGKINNNLGEKVTQALAENPAAGASSDQGMSTEDIDTLVKSRVNAQIDQKLKRVEQDVAALKEQQQLSSASMEGLINEAVAETDGPRPDGDSTASVSDDALQVLENRLDVVEAESGGSSLPATLSAIALIVAAAAAAVAALPFLPV
ncbi:Response regulator MprA [BD1-7 clade bacterium]|uniref:Response regulator MprA n=1 Tax=BD1-7 clade bacterium TaxID=2029982 RepID=A0A5S9QYV5_9GAMM|nr:Response regulator MprA [BD1-7 clade bacterium]